MSIKLKVKYLRQELGMTQKQLAKLCNVENYVVANWEQGRSEPCIEDIKKLCVIFSLSADELLEIETEKQRNEIKINNSFNNFKNHGTINITNK